MYYILVLVFVTRNQWDLWTWSRKLISLFSVITQITSHILNNIYCHIGADCHWLAVQIELAPRTDLSGPKASGLSVSSGWPEWFEAWENLLGVRRVVEASLSKSLLHAHPGVRHNLENTQRTGSDHTVYVSFVRFQNTDTRWVRLSFHTSSVVCFPRVFYWDSKVSYWSLKVWYWSTGSLDCNPVTQSTITKPKCVLHVSDPVQMWACAVDSLGALKRGRGCLKSCLYEGNVYPSQTLLWCTSWLI